MQDDMNTPAAPAADSNAAVFDRLWTSFSTAVRGRLNTAMGEGRLDPKRASAILAEAAESWKNVYESEGRWLANLLKSDPARGEAVQRILTRDMHFEPETFERPGRAPAVLGAVAAGGVGYGVAQAIGMGTLATVATTVLPLAAGAVAGSIYTARRRTAAEEAVVTAYSDQLEGYATAVRAILTV